MALHCISEDWTDEIQSNEYFPKRIYQLKATVTEE